MPGAEAALIQVDWDDPRAQGLRDAMDAEITPRYSDAATTDEQAAARRALFAVRPEDMVATFLILDRDRAVAMGALRRLGEEWELKRLVTLPEYRGRGYSTRIIRAVEDEARRRGGTRLVLQTGNRQPEAVRVYEYLGFRPIPVYGPYTAAPESLCFAKDL